MGLGAIGIGLGVSGIGVEDVLAEGANMGVDVNGIGKDVGGMGVDDMWVEVAGMGMEIADIRYDIAGMGMDVGGIGWEVSKVGIEVKSFCVEATGFGLVVGAANIGVDGKLVGVGEDVNVVTARGRGLDILGVKSNGCAAFSEAGMEWSGILAKDVEGCAGTCLMGTRPGGFCFRANFLVQGIPSQNLTCEFSFSILLNPFPQLLHVSVPVKKHYNFVK